MKETTRIIRFAIIGTLNALITAGVIGLMMEVGHIGYMLSNVVGYLVAQTHNFIWSKYWIFPVEQKKNNIWKQMLFFSIAVGVAYAAQFLFLVVLVEFLGVHEYLAQFLGLILYGVVNFMMNRKVTFK